jgi:hypothetical protein
MSGSKMNVEKEIEQLKARVERLERTLAPTPKSKAPTKGADFKGATGGVRFLVSEGYFRSQRIFGDIIAELKKRGYLYSKQAFQDALTRLSRPGGPLVRITDKGKKIYAERK